MIRLPQAIVAVMTCTLVSGVAGGGGGAAGGRVPPPVGGWLPSPARPAARAPLGGGVVGATVGRLAPSFVGWLHSPAGQAAVDPMEFGFGLGTVSGLFLGAGTGVFLVCVLALRDAWLLRAGVSPSPPVKDAHFE